MKTKRITKNLMTLVAFLVAFCLSGNLYADVKIAVIDSGSTEKVYKSISFSKIPGNIDPIGHGTKIAKLIKNGNPEAEIYMLQVCEKQGFGYRPSQESVLKAIEWCVDNDIDIVNLSLVIQYNKKIEEAIKQAHYDKGILFIAAAGNRSIFNQFAVNSDGYVYSSKSNVNTMFPAACDYVLSVGAHDSLGKIAEYSANDADVYTQGSYSDVKGTSFACARITGIASRILASNHNISLPELRDQLDDDEDDDEDDDDDEDEDSTSNRRRRPRPPFKKVLFN